MTIVRVEDLRAAAADEGYTLDADGLPDGFEQEPVDTLIDYAEALAERFDG